MNVLTRSVDRTATDVVLETQWPRLPLSIGITPAFHTAMSPMSSYGFERTELPMTDMVYNYKTGSGDVELSNFTTWIIGAMSYDFEWNKLPMTDMVYNYKTGSGDVDRITLPQQDPTSEASREVDRGRSSAANRRMPCKII